MSSELALSLSGVGKAFKIFASPRERLLQWLLPHQRRYTEFHALQDVSFQVQRGETVGIIGQNGSGKSTLLQIVCGTLMPTSGQVEVNGRVAALLELGAGFNPEFTGRENVYLNSAIYGLTREETDERMESILAFAEIGEFIDRPVKSYSSGMYVRLAFSVIAHVDADILIIDEALAVGDALFTQKCMRFLRRFQENGTILFVSHDSAAVVNLCRRAVWLDHGKIAQMGDAKAVSEAYLASLFRTSASSKTSGITERAPTIPKQEDWVDSRASLINGSTLRNDLEVFRFNPDEADFGQGGAAIVDVQLADDAERPMSFAVGGEIANLIVRVEAKQDLDRAIVGFYVKDRLGQALFGDNTYLTYADNPRQFKAGEVFIAKFRFPMPYLPVGDYSIAVSVANGTQIDHVQHHWIHDALIFRSHASSVASGLVGIPMLNVDMHADSQIRSPESEVKG